MPKAIKTTSMDAAASEIVKLRDRGEREFNKRRENSIKEANAARAFDLLSDMEDEFLRLEQAKAALRLIAGDSALEDCVQSALSLLSDVIDEALEKVVDLRDEASHKTWAYKHAPSEVNRAASTRLGA